MAIHLLMEDVQGSSSDPDHRNWIDIIQSEWKINRKITARSSTRHDRESSNAEFSELTFTKHVDSATPALVLAACCGVGRTITIEQTKTGNGAGSETFLQYIMHNAVVSDYRMAAWADDDERPLEKIKISFTPKLAINVFALLASLFLTGCGPSIVEMDETDPGALITAMAPYVPEYDGRSDKAIRNNAKVITRVANLVRKGANVNYTIKSNGYTPLHVATLYNEPKLVELLLNNGANQNTRATIGEKMTPLELANKTQRKTGKDYSQVIRLLTP